MAEIPENIKQQIDVIRQKCARIKPRVAIHSLAYNHGPYIREALDGFIHQQTDFPFVAIVHEDASTDNTASILKEYAEKYSDIIFPLFEIENQYSRGNGILNAIMKSAIYSTGAEYVAVCEGDDYWIDPLKLQKQLEILDSDPEYLMVYSKCFRFNSCSPSIKDVWGGPSTSFIQLADLNTIPTLTTFFRFSILEKYNKASESWENNWLMGDYPMWLFFSLHGKIFFHNEVSAHYRIISESASHSESPTKQLKFKKSCNDVSLFFLKDRQDAVSRQLYQAKVHLQKQYIYMESLLKCKRNHLLNANTIKYVFFNKMGFKQRLKMLFLLFAGKRAVKLYL